MAINEILQNNNKQGQQQQVAPQMAGRRNIGVKLAARRSPSKFSSRWDAALHDRDITTGDAFKSYKSFYTKISVQYCALKADRERLKKIKSRSNYTDFRCWFF